MSTPTGAAAPPPESIFLMPGALAFARTPTVMRTLLGSCVSVVVWHPKLHWGGMCHFMLPHRARAAATPADGRYGSEALGLLWRQMAQHSIPPQQYQVHVCGGARCYEAGSADSDIGQRNIEVARRWMQAQGLQPGMWEVGGRLHRHLEFDTDSGVLRMREGNDRVAETRPMELL